MTTTQELHKLGQSLWLDNITRGILDDGTLKRYIDELSVTGLTSNPTIFDEAIGGSALYDKASSKRRETGCPARHCSSSWRSRICAVPPTCSGPSSTARAERTAGCRWRCLRSLPKTPGPPSRRPSGSTSLPDRPNLYVKIPGTREGVPAIEEAIFAGVPVNVTLLFSREQYLAVAEAYMRGIERRIAAKLDPKVSSVASIFVSRWDRAVAGKVPAELTNRLGIAVAGASIARTPTSSPASVGAILRPPARSAAHAVGEHRREGPEGAADTCTSRRWPRPETIDTMPEKTLLAFAKEGKIRGVMATDGIEAEKTLALFRQGRCRHRRRGETAADRRGAILRQILDGAHAEPQGQEQGTGRIVSGRIDSARGPAGAGARLSNMPRLITRLLQPASPTRT